MLLETIIKESDGILKINHQLKSNDFELILSTTIEQFKDIIEVDPCNPSLNVEVFVQKVGKNILVFNNTTIYFVACNFLSVKRRIILERTLK